MPGRVHPAGRPTRDPPSVLAERLMLFIYAYGTNTGVRAVAAGDHGHSEDDLRYILSRYFTVPACREVARAIANATFAAPPVLVMGAASQWRRIRPSAPRSTKIIFTEWHSRYRRGKRGVLICRMVENKGAMAAHSQCCPAAPPKSTRWSRAPCGTAHRYDHRIQLRALPRRLVHRVRHHPAARIRPDQPHASLLPEKGSIDSYPLLAASTEALLRRLTRDVTTPPTRRCWSWAVQHETTAALNVVEKLQQRQRLHPLRQVRRTRVQPPAKNLGFVNTLIPQYILGEPEWAGVLGDADLRGITPLFTSNMTPLRRHPARHQPSTRPRRHEPRSSVCELIRAVPYVDR